MCVCNSYFIIQTFELRDILIMIHAFIMTTLTFSKEKEHIVLFFLRIFIIQVIHTGV